MLDLVAGIQMARRATEERVAYDADMLAARQWTTCFDRPMLFLRRPSISAVSGARRAQSDPSILLGGLGALPSTGLEPRPPA